MLEGMKQSEYLSDKYFQILLERLLHIEVTVVKSKNVKCYGCS